MKCSEILLDVSSVIKSPLSLNFCRASKTTHTFTAHSHWHSTTHPSTCKHASIVKEIAFFICVFHSAFKRKTFHHHMLISHILKTGFHKCISHLHSFLCSFSPDRHTCLLSYSCDNSVFIYVFILFITWNFHPYSSLTLSTPPILWFLSYASSLEKIHWFGPGFKKL